MEEICQLITNLQRGKAFFSDHDKLIKMIKIIKMMKIIEIIDIIKIIKMIKIREGFKN